MTGTSAFAENQVSKVCGLWPYVSWADADTDQTITDAKVNNARKDGFCGKPTDTKRK